MATSRLLLKSSQKFSTQNLTSHVCIVGAGPAGFYAAQQILKVSNHLVLYENVNKLTDF